MGQEDKAETKSRRSADGWNRNRMNKTHTKGKKKAKAQIVRARRRVGIALIKASLEKEG